MARSIDRYLRLMPAGSRQRPSERHWSPAADVYQLKEGWLIKLDLAGVSPEEIEITVAGRVVVVGGSRRDAFCTETVSFHQMEITYSRFEKTLRAHRARLPRRLPSHLPPQRRAGLRGEQSAISNQQSAGGMRAQPTSHFSCSWFG
jgi:HSP20 family protein